MFKEKSGFSVGLFYFCFMNLIFFDSAERVHLLPFTFTRPCAELRIGILTISEKWRHHFRGAACFYHTQPYLHKKFPLEINEKDMLINGTICPTAQLVSEIMELKPGEALVQNELLIAACLSSKKELDEENILAHYQRKNAASADFIQVKRVWDIFSQNGKAIEQDYELLSKGRTSATLNATNRTVNPERIFVEEGARVDFAIINASTGPVYIGKDAEIMEGTIIRGPFALCEHAGTKMGAKIYGPTTVGPYCKVGGEVNNSVLMAYSNKGHDGFLGNSVIGEWCNLGADTNNSNLKNNYQEVKVWSYASERFVKTGLQFCGLMMGDHSKAGINTMFNTGTVVGVAANVFGSGFPRNYIPSFAWGGAHGFETFQLPKVIEMAKAMCERRKVAFTTDDREILEHVFLETKKNRFWEKQ
jgi:UDP-N-acetylglucosamine diphosphorylase/glucosamine-1-phosphate N-acetyltransferase